MGSSTIFTLTHTNHYFFKTCKTNECTCLELAAKPEDLYVQATSDLSCS